MPPAPMHTMPTSTPMHEKGSGEETNMKKKGPPKPMHQQAPPGLPPPPQQQQQGNAKTNAHKNANKNPNKNKSNKKMPPKPMHEITKSTRSMDIDSATKSARGKKGKLDQEKSPPHPSSHDPKPKPAARHPSAAPTNMFDVNLPSDPNYGSGQTINIVHVAEKPSIASSIAKALSSRGAHNYSDHKGIGTPVHEFTAVNPVFKFASRAAETCHKVTSVTGHVYNVDFGAKYQSWDSVDPQELYTAPIVRKPSKGSIVRHLETVGKGADFVVLWMDCDREGENINFEVLGIVMPVMKNGGKNDRTFARVYRAHFSAISEGDILKAYGALGKPDQHQSQAVDARQELDLKIGVR